MFISVGRAPATELFRSELALDKSGYIVADESTRTNLPGVFAAGDVADPHYRQAITAAASGCKAGIEVEKYLKNKKEF